jgi:oxygen-independent coproporphyrinogen-3 oxidase
VLGCCLSSGARLGEPLIATPVAGIYVHVPFCVRKCDYCDFASFDGLSQHRPAYVAAVCQELDLETPRWQAVQFVSLFLGGGTPTVLPDESLAQIVAAVRAALPWREVAEVTIEANPGTLTAQRLGALRQMGINRLSLGVQSWHDDELRLLGRIHTAAEARAAVQAARQAGFDNLSLDLMYGLPCQTLARWETSLAQAQALEPEHLSLYGLSLEEGTPLAARVAQGALPEPDDDLAADMYSLAEERLAAAGYRHYEISNWARSTFGDDQRDYPALASRHNLLYWQNERYLGLGSAAASFDGQTRTVARTHPLDYIAAISAGQSVVESAETLSAAERLDETVMLGLRLARGVRWQEMQTRFGVDARAVYAPTIAEQQALGLLAEDEAGMRLTAQGRLLGNRVFAAFLRN